MGDYVELTGTINANRKGNRRNCVLYQSIFNEDDIDEEESSVSNRNSVADEVVDKVNSANPSFLPGIFKW